LYYCDILVWQAVFPHLLFFFVSCCFRLFSSAGAARCGVSLSVVLNVGVTLSSNRLLFNALFFLSF
jgi:hypothetical protein